jgi:hypothetical protein
VKLSINNQLGRDVSTLALNVFGIFVYISLIRIYLHQLTLPEPLLFALMFSLVFNIYYEFKAGISRLTHVRILCTIIIFCVAAFLAQEIRGVYLTTMTELTNYENAEELIGQEYLKAAQNRVVGYGGCFAVGLVTARMLLYKILVNVASRVLVLPNYRGNVCPMCQQPTQIH